MKECFPRARNGHYVVATTNGYSPDQPTDIELMTKEDKGNDKTRDQQEELMEGHNSDLSAARNNTRVKWASKTEYLLTCVGYAVGLGNIWRFPYLCYKNGGGAFLVPYLLTLIVCGIPMVAMEMSVGQSVGLGLLPLWKICPAFKGLGYAITMIVANASLCYIVLIAYSLYYLIDVFSAQLPWENCANEWNTDRCLGLGAANTSISQMFKNVSDFAIGNFSTSNSSGFNITYRSPSEEYFLYKVLNISNGLHEIGAPQWRLVVCLIVCWLLVYLSTFKGIRTGGKVSYFTATLPYLMLTILVIRGALMPGSIEGVKFYLWPKWHLLLDVRVWVNGAVQIFYSVGPGLGLYITMSSYNNYRNNCLRDAAIIVSINSATSIYAGFAVFSVLGAMAHELGVPVDDVVNAGAGLAFVTYPRALLSLPLPQLWSAIFFLMLLLLGIGSEMVLIENMLTALVDEWPWFRTTFRRAALSACILTTFCCLCLIFVTRGGMYYFTLADWYSSQFGMMITAFLECIVFSWIYGYRRLAKDIENMTGYKPNIYYQICWRFLSPLAVILMIVANMYDMAEPSVGNYTFSPLANILGWCLVGLQLFPIPAYFVYKLVQSKGTVIDRLKNITRPSDDYDEQIHKRTTSTADTTTTVKKELDSCPESVKLNKLDMP